MKKSKFERLWDSTLFYADCPAPSLTIKEEREYKCQKCSPSNEERKQCWKKFLEVKK